MERQVLEKVLGGMSAEGGSMSILEFTRLIQRAEGNFDCFGTAFDGECDQEACLWRGTCFTESAARKRMN